MLVNTGFQGTPEDLNRDYNPENYEVIERVGASSLYPLSRAWFRHKRTGVEVEGTFNEQTGEKLIGEVLV